MKMKDIKIQIIITHDHSDGTAVVSAQEVFSGEELVQTMLGTGDFLEDKVSGLISHLVKAEAATREALGQVKAKDAGVETREEDDL